MPGKIDQSVAVERVLVREGGNVVVACVDGDGDDDSKMSLRRRCHCCYCSREPARDIPCLSSGKCPHQLKEVMMIAKHVRTRY